MAVFPALFVLAMAAVVKGQIVEISTRSEVRRAGDPLTVICRVDYPITACRFMVSTGESFRVEPNVQDPRMVYAGQGYEQGECGVQMKHVDESWNGNLSCYVPAKVGISELSATMRLTIAVPPGPLELLAPQQSSFREGDVFMGQCVVPHGRPAANITWFLDDEPLLVGVHQPVITPEADGFETIKQNITRSLGPDDDQKRLICRSQHLALDQPQESSRQLLVHYKPRGFESGLITIFGLKLGAEGSLNVSVRSNPAPSAVWTVADRILHAPQVSEPYRALAPEHLGGGNYTITLVLDRITKEDVDRTYLLRVSNDLGTEEFTVRLSTMDEPAGVDLDTAAIVGIVIGVLVILIAIFLIVFAKATERWCFAGGRSRDLTKSSGESSDTESAAGRGERSRLGALRARMRNVLPKRDGVRDVEVPAESDDKISRLGALQARLKAVLPKRETARDVELTAENDEKPLSDDKKGVVYAELALGDQASEKPPPPATEYAEIVYTDQPQVKEAKE